MLETERLILRNWQAADLEPFAAINADPRVMEFFPACLSRAESDQLAGRISARLNQRGWGLYAVESKNTAAFLGFTGLSVPAFEAAFTPCVEIGWRIAHAAWGQGIATEAATAVVQFAFSRLNLPELVSFTTAANVRSRRVMEKVGMAHRAEDDFDHPAIPQGHPLRRHVLYRLGNSLHFAALNPTVASQRLLNPSPGRQG
jgi:RimJ/RimL family protein N-acetyltransferase